MIQLVDERKSHRDLRIEVQVKKMKTVIEAMQEPAQKTVQKVRLEIQARNFRLDLQPKDSREGPEP
jgi:hypothetical protein